MEITATEQTWNSATTLYIARRLSTESESRAAPMQVLDLGCGTGNLIRSFLPYGHSLHGCDFPRRDDALRQNLLPEFGEEYDDRIRIMSDERSIPFEDRRFDVIYANQVFEHVRFIDALMSECTRVLRPGGTLIALFPLATTPIEGHVRVPIAHWLPSGPTRTRYLRAMSYLRIGKQHPGMSRSESAAQWNSYLEQQTFYRFLNEFTSLASYHFDRHEIDTGRFVDAKLDLVGAGSGRANRLAHRIGTRLRGPLLDSAVTLGLSATIVMHLDD